MRHRVTDDMLLGPDAAPDSLATAPRQQARTGDTVAAPGDLGASPFWVESGALRFDDLDRDGASTDKNFHIDGPMPWPCSATGRHEAGVHAGPTGWRASLAAPAQRSLQG